MSPVDMKALSGGGVIGIDHWSSTGGQSGWVKASNLCGPTSGRRMSSSSTLMNVKVLQMFIHLWNMFSLD